MNEIDWIIAALLGVSTLVGVARGVVREVMALVGWVAAIFLSLNFSVELAGMIPLPDVALIIRIAMAGLAIVIATLVATGLFGKLVGHLISAASISFEDRAIGSLFGFVRGVVIVSVLVFIFGMTSAVKSGYWRNSILIVPAETVIDFALPYMPDSIQKMRNDYRVKI